MRGVKKKFIDDMVKSMTNNHSIEIIALCETKTNSLPSPDGIKKIGFKNFDSIPCQGRSGCIWLF